MIINSTSVRFAPDRFKLVHPSRRGRTYYTVGQVCLCARTGRMFMTYEHRTDSCQHTAKHTDVCKH